MRGRAMVGAAIIAAWLAGLGVLVQREFFRPRLERFAEAAMRVQPAAVYYGVMQGDRQIGFASSTTDTSNTDITVTDYFVADLPIGGKPHRATARTNVTLSRALRVRSFDLDLETDNAPITATGKIEGDSVLVLGIITGTDTSRQRIALHGPILLPTLVPLALALGETPKVGKRYVLPVFDPSTMSAKDVGIDVRAESTFVVNDSAVFDSTSRRWHGVHADTLKAWRVTAESAAGFTGWVDEQGHIVSTTQLGLAIRRLPYEVAFENWRADSAVHLAVTSDRDILETTAIAARVKPGKWIQSLTVRLGNVNLAGFDLDGAGQRLVGNELTVDRATRQLMLPGYTLPRHPVGVDEKYLRPEPLIQSDDPALFQVAYRVQAFEHNPLRVAWLLNRFVHDSVRSRITFGVPSATEVLRTRVGDCNEHTQLYVAMARAIGIPARVAAGLAYVDGKFYYHAWPEVYLGDWVAVDPTFDEYPADAAHLRFTIGGLGRQTELLRLMGNLKIDVLNASTKIPRPNGTPAATPAATAGVRGRGAVKR